MFKVFRYPISHKLEVHVKFDPTLSSVDKLVGAITNVGYQTHVKSADVTEKEDGND